MDMMYWMPPYYFPQPAFHRYNHNRPVNYEDYPPFFRRYTPDGLDNTFPQV
jgi:hypothetical protein